MFRETFISIPVTQCSEIEPLLLFNRPVVSIASAMNLRFLPTLPQASSSPNSCYAVRLASHLSTRYPFRTLLVVYILPILALVFLCIDRSFRVDDPIFSDYFLRYHERTRRYDARNAVHHRFDKEVNDAPQNDILVNRQRAIPDSGLSFILLFRMPSKSDNILTPRHIATMKRAEDIVFENDKFPRICFRNPIDPEACSTHPCTLPTSLLSSPAFYAINDSSSGRVCRKSGSTLLAQEEITQFVHNLDQSSRYAPCVGRSAFTQNTTWIAASYFIVGVPFGVNEPETLSSNQMYDIYAEWITTILPILSESTAPHFETFVFGSQLTRIRVGQAITKDTVFAAVALGVVAMFIVAHTCSLFLAIMTALQVFFSIPVSLIIYWYIFNIPFFSVLQVFAIYLLVGIAADDVFVFTDAWKQSFVVLSSQDDLYTRMVWTYSRAVAAMTVTTVTTAFAFLLLLTSPIMPIATLGAWAALIITVQFILVITAYPCVLVLWQCYFRNRSYLGFGRVNCCSPLSRPFRQPAISPGHDIDIGSEDVGNLSPTATSTPNNSPRLVTTLHEVVTGSSDRNTHRGETSNSGTAAETIERPSQPSACNYRFVEQIFRDRWITVLFKIRYILVVCAVAMLVTCTVLACLLKTSEREDRPLRRYNPNEVAVRHIRDELPTTLENDFLEVRLTWGILDISHQGSNYYDRDEVGEPIMDKSFDLKPKEAQDFLLETCRNIRKRTELVLKDTEHDSASRCWIEDFSNWRSKYRGKKEFETFKNDETLGFEILSFAKEEVNGEMPYMKYIEEKDVILSLKTDQVVATELRFLSQQKWQSPLGENQAEYKRWENITNELNKNGPPSMKNCFATSGYPWVFAITQETLLFSMRPGIGIMLMIAFIIMCIATGNLTIAVLTTCAVGGVLGIVFAFVYIVGWDLGVAECLSAVISVGYAFDGVAHIGKAYAESDEGSQEQRTRDGLTALGISVLFGTLSTATSALMLLFTQVLMLFKFGVLVAVTMAATLLWALVLLPAGLLVFGPCKKDQWLRQFIQRAWKACNACGYLNKNGNTDDATATPDNDVGEVQEKQRDDAGWSSDRTLVDAPCGTNERAGDEDEIQVNPL